MAKVRTKGTEKRQENNQSKFNHGEIESKWQKKWQEEGIYQTPKETGRKKKYVLDMFPYPSGATMHVGHLEGYIGTDILTRFLRMRGNSVLHPMGWDAFGLPAENYAIKTGIHPDESTHKNIDTFKKQLSRSGLSYDWTREIDTSDPNYYKWTQWLFIQMFKAGLAYKKKAPVNWCPKDETVLANEQVVDGKCERCDTPVVQKELEQWFFKITDYADRLIDGLDKLDWMPDVKIQQKNWIGKSEGLYLDFEVKDSREKISVFTTAVDTIFGVTFMVLSPHHPILSKMDIPDNARKTVTEYINIHQSSTKTPNTSGAEEKEKTGVFTGLFVKHPFKDVDIPIWISNYVVMEYGTGAVMGVPGHDSRDREFAQNFDLPIIPVIKPRKEEDYERVTQGDGFWDYTEIKTEFKENSFLFDSEEYNGLTSAEAKKRLTEFIEKTGIGYAKSTYHLRDWLISRQRYWGAPIPMVYCEEHAWQSVNESDLPVKLPIDVDFLPHGESPIARSKSFQEGVVCPKCGKPAKRETDTMDGFADNSWYFIRFVDPKNDKEFAGKDAIEAWLPVDIYVGGGHVVQHLLYARFFWKVLYDEGLLPKSVGEEPFLKLRAPGWILGPDSRKMSKRWGNVITPDDIIPKFGADVLRLYEMFMGPFDIVKPWNITGVEGMRRFVEKVWKLFDAIDGVQIAPERAKELEVKKHKTIKRVTSEIENFRFNTAIAAIMEYVNLLRYSGQKASEHKNISGSNEWKEALKVLVQLLAPFAPHMAEEAWCTILNEPFSVHTSVWPQFDPKLVIDEEVTIAIQVNGKLRSTIIFSKEKGDLKEEVLKGAKSDLRIAKWLEGQEVKKEIFVPGKLVNFVVAN